MKNVEYDHAIQSDPSLRETCQAASRILAEEIGPTADLAKARWELESDAPGRRLLRLTLTNWAGEETRVFAPEDLRPAEHARRPFYRLWGDLLQNALHRRIQQLEQATVGGD